MEVSGVDLFSAFLLRFSESVEIEKIHLLCLENPPGLYMQSSKLNDKIALHNFFSDSCGWNGNSNYDLNLFISNFNLFSGAVLFIDSLYHFIERLGFFGAFQVLHKLKLRSKSIICLVHHDLLSSTEIEKFECLSTIDIKLLHNHKNSSNLKTAKIVHKKLNGKISCHTEVFSINDDLSIFSQVSENKKSSTKPNSNKTEFDGLTTFELGLNMRESEKKAKEQLVLPYLR